MNSSNEAADNTGGALPSMALMATLQTATSVWEGVRERRAGRDPSGQEPASAARAYLKVVAEELLALHMQLLMAKVQADRQNKASASEKALAQLPLAKRPARLRRMAVLVRRFDMLMKLRRVDRLLHGSHQRLMSLYPQVSEELVEEARYCQREGRRLRGASPAGFAVRLGPFLERLLSFAVWMQHEL